MLHASKNPSIRPFVGRCLFLAAWCATALPAQESPPEGEGKPVVELERIAGAEARNLVVIVSDDHRADATGYAGHPWLETPHLDALARNGVRLKNAFVTTALSGPSRASLLTGQYAHHHGVISDRNTLAQDAAILPRWIRQAGYETAFFGKWPGGGDTGAPPPGFDYSVRVEGEGSYRPEKRKTYLNVGEKRIVDGKISVKEKRIPQKTYLTDELTDYALRWLGKRNGKNPFLVFISHKSLQGRCIPAGRHQGRYRDAEFPEPATMAATSENYRDKPRWLMNQRNSWHGVDFPFHNRIDLGQFYRHYCETLLAVDDSVGRILQFLREKGLVGSTLVFYTADSGFLFGEHGLIDKRVAYEESIRVPMLMHCPDLFEPGTVVEQIVANIDVAPTLLEAVGRVPPASMDGRSFLALAQGKEVSPPWRESLPYVYYWEYEYPHTPTLFALRGSRYKYIHYYGLWDADELYDVEDDPLETENLYFNPASAGTVAAMQEALFGALGEVGALQIPLVKPGGSSYRLRSREGSGAAQFPERWMEDGAPVANPGAKEEK